MPIPLSIGCALPVEIPVSPCDDPVNSGELFHTLSPSGKLIPHSTPKQGMSGGNRKVPYAAPIFTHPQSTPLTTVTLSIKRSKEIQRTKTERTSR